jgi:hypothetical protein
MYTRSVANRPAISHLKILDVEREATEIVATGIGGEKCP